MNKIIERMRNGERITETDADFPLLCSEIENTKKLVHELNTQYHSPDEIRALLERIWGQHLDASVRIFPPFYTAFGKLTRVGKEVFINFSCTFRPRWYHIRGRSIYRAGSKNCYREPSRRTCFAT